MSETKEKRVNKRAEENKTPTQTKKLSLSLLTSASPAGPALGRPRPRRVQVHQQRVQVERVRQDHAPHLRPAQRQRLERLRGPAPRHELDVFEVRVHRAVDADDGALDDGAVLELDLDGLVDELGEEAGVVSLVFGFGRSETEGEGREVRRKEVGDERRGRSRKRRRRQ